MTTIPALAEVYANVSSLLATPSTILGVDTTAGQILAAAAVIGPFSYAVYSFLLSPLYLSPLSKIPGPPVGWLPGAGNFVEIIKEEGGLPQLRWAKKYGGILVYHSLFNTPRILLTDPKLIQQTIGSNAYDYPKSTFMRKSIGRILGIGLLFAEGDEHKYQRKMLNPAFSLRYIREIVPIFFGPAMELRNLWRAEMIGEDSAELDILDGMSKATLDIIGLAGFGYDFQAIKSEPDSPNELNKAYTFIFSPRPRLPNLLGQYIPILGKLLRASDLPMRRALETVNKVSKELVTEAKTRKVAGKQGMDLLSILVNEKNEETGEPMNDVDLQAQIMNFLAAGHETTSVSTTWCLYLLAQKPQIQAALRAEVAPLFQSLDRDSLPTYDSINQLDLLNRVVKETLRLIPPVPMTNRVNLHDTELGGYHIPKGTIIFYSAAVTQRDERVWGPDAFEFNPDRWLEEPARSIGPYTYMPFLTGVRQCIGNKFALMEMKVLIATLVAAFVFKEKEGWVVTKKQSITWRPHPGVRLVVERA